MLRLNSTLVQIQAHNGIKEKVGYIQERRPDMMNFRHGVKPVA